MTIPSRNPAAAIDVQEVLEVAIEGYVFLYPLITMDVTRRIMTNVPAGQMPGSFFSLRQFS